jgi:hypothetical protein
MSVKTSTPSRSMRRRQQRAGRDDPHPRAHGVEQEDVGAGDAAVQDVAADGDGEALDAALAAADGEGVEQGLGRVLVAAVAGVDHRAADLLGQQLDRAGGIVAHHQQSGRMAFRVIAVSIRVSPFLIDE